MMKWKISEDWVKNVSFGEFLTPGSGGEHISGGGGGGGEFDAFFHVFRVLGVFWGILDSEGGNPPPPPNR